MFNNASGFAINGAQFADVQGNWVENNGQWSEYNVREQFNDNKVTTVFNANTYTGNAVHNQHTVKDTVSCIQSATRISGGSSQKSFSSRCGPGTYMQSKRSSSGSSQGSYATSKRQASSEYGDGHSNAYPLSITEPTYYSNEGSKLTIDFDPITNEPLVYVGDPNDSSQDFYTRVPAMITDDIRDFFDHTLKDAGIHLDFDSQDVDDCKGPFPLEGLEEEDVDNAGRFFRIPATKDSF
ncbi:hypothetical protein FA15DRAFT_244518 [Coprinopsis marcescibilis]|uniref:Uncharacterized protein n=1 Tax=Coprinopsis marcescibilis TaxID=230819 RepID=A0A5C3L452_COPMA|nr:hypothetical protein FA15DRAFT_244518 [Coprinopsis marcescibilis]